VRPGPLPAPANATHSTAGRCDRYFAHSDSGTPSHGPGTSLSVTRAAAGCQSRASDSDGVTVPPGPSPNPGPYYRDGRAPSGKKYMRFWIFRYEHDRRLGRNGSVTASPLRVAIMIIIRVSDSSKLCLTAIELEA
jgi:hypothetical protein